MDLTAHSSTAWFLLFLKQIKIKKKFLLQRFEWDLQALAVNFTFLWFCGSHEPKFPFTLLSSRASLDFAACEELKDAVCLMIVHDSLN